MSDINNIEVRVCGTVQGVGFRPTVWRLALAHNLLGDVCNDNEGVLIRLCGLKADVDNFLSNLPKHAPPLAKIDSIDVQTVAQISHFERFEIIQSKHQVGHTQISPDAATCIDCLNEIGDSSNRRYRYPFTNCTHCGPRVTIVQGIPYDRCQTTMSTFEMCADCLAEYQNPNDRRFHAQPNACPRCGPQIYLHSADGSVNESDDYLVKVQQFLTAGKIVAIRGIGGFHLCCDATNHAAVERLRQRKRRYAKPFALMSHQLKTIEHYCQVSDVERDQLQSAWAPIVLMDAKITQDDALPPLSAQVAPGTNLLGFMLPYTPLHWMIAEQFGKPLVMTSGNLSHQVPLTDNTQAIDTLSAIADLIVYHNREIANRIDDSVVRYMAGKPRLLRRARGFAPRSFTLPDGFEQCPDLLAFGAELKSTFCLVKAGSAIVSQHQGDLEDVSTFDDYQKNLALYADIFNHSPSILVADNHPQYLSTQMAVDALDENTQLIQVQHHHAHIASCMAENDVALSLNCSNNKVLGIALDGLGFGDDGTLWGGEFLLADYCDYQRVGCFKSVAMIGGAQAIINPWRNTFAHIKSAFDWPQYVCMYANTPLYRFFDKQPLDTMNKMLSNQMNVPLASSCGRLFDAVSAALNLCREQAYFEGQGAIALEAKVVPEQLFDNPYPFSINQDDKGLVTLDPAPMWHQLLQDQYRKVSVETIATRFHGGLINAVFTMANQLLKQHSIDTVVLSGGCFANKVLFEGLTQKLASQGYRCLSHSKVPSNDGGISLGQAVIGAARVLQHQQTGA